MGVSKSKFFELTISLKCFENFTISRNQDHKFMDWPVVWSSSVTSKKSWNAPFDLSFSRTQMCVWLFYGPAHLEKSSGTVSYQSIQSLLWPSIHSFLPSQWCQPPRIDSDPHRHRRFSLCHNGWADRLDPLSSATYSSHHRHRLLALHQALQERDCLEESYRAFHLNCYHPHQSEALFLTMLIWNIFE